MADYLSVELEGTIYDPELPDSGSRIMWYDLNDQQVKLKYYFYSGSESWSAGVNLRSQYRNAVTGDPDNALSFGGSPSSALIADEFNGISWSSVNNLPVTSSDAYGTGLQNSTAGSYQCCFYAYNGSTWSNRISSNINRTLYGLTGGEQNTLQVGGSSPNSSCVEEWDGAAWSDGGALILGRSQVGVAGTQNAATTAGGVSSPTYTCCIEEYNGTSWTNVGSTLPGFVGNHFAAGSQNDSIFTAGVISPYTEIYHWNGSTFSTGPTSPVSLLYSRISGGASYAITTGGYDSPSSLNCTQLYIGSGSLKVDYFPIPEEEILDEYEGAAAAYSLRSLSVNSSNVVRIRRDSDNSEQDFTATEITDGTLATFVGSGNNGYVITWYDQSGNNRHVTQTTAAYQPKIYDASTGLVLQNAKPAIDFDGVDDFLLSSFENDQVTDYFTFIVFNKPVSGQRWVLLYNNISRSDTEISLFNTTIRTWYGINEYFDQAVPDFSINNHLLFHHYMNQNAVTIGLDGIIYANQYPISSFITVFNHIKISGRGFIYALRDLFKGTLQEIIIYTSDQSSNREGIERNINEHYNIYIH